MFFPFRTNQRHPVLNCKNIVNIKLTIGIWHFVSGFGSNKFKAKIATLSDDGMEEMKESYPPSLVEVNANTDGIFKQFGYNAHIYFKFKVFSRILLMHTETLKVFMQLCPRLPLEMNFC